MQHQKNQDESKQLAQKYTAHYKEEKLRAYAKYFSGSQLVKDGSTFETQTNHATEGGRPVQIKEGQRHAVQAFLDTPRMPEDLAPYLQ